jgi:hypothetical protein
MSVLLVYGLVTNYLFEIKSTVIEENGEEAVAKPDVFSSTFVINEEEFALVNGKAEIEIVPGAASREVVRIFGEPIYGDLDSDGDNDAAVLLEYTTGGSGTFYYAVLAMQESDSYRTTNTLLLGDRIAPQTVAIEDGRAVYNYAIRRQDENFGTAPSIGKSLYIHYDAASGTIGEWVKDFEGESNFTERYSAQVDRVKVVFEHMNFTSYRLVTNGLVREGELNTERGYKDDLDATVFVLNWQQPEGQQMRYVKLTNEPNKLYVLDGAGERIMGGALVLE